MELFLPLQLPLHRAIMMTYRVFRGAHCAAAQHDEEYNQMIVYVGTMARFWPMICNVILKK